MLQVSTRALGLWVHLGQEDGEPRGVPYGRSCHVEADLARLPRGADLRYIGFGPVYPTGTKETGFDPRGLDGLALAVGRAPVPVVAIGGITVDNIAAVRSTGVAAWAVIAGIWAAPDPRAAIRLLR